MREARDAAEAASLTKSEFLANMSHELRTPLNAIIGFSEIMMNELFGSIGTATYRDYAVDIHESGHHLLTLINDILDVSKAEAGKIELREEPVDLGEAVRSSIRLVRARAESGDVAISVRDCCMPLVLRADGRRLKQILLNILANAIKFTPAGGEVSVNAWREPDGRLVLVVEDTGIGIAAEDIPKALAPFSQIEGHPGTEQEGTGLGLPLTKSLMELHGGKLEIDSTPGHGTIVRLSFPATRVIASAAPAIGAKPEMKDARPAPLRRAATS